MSGSVFFGIVVLICGFYIIQGVESASSKSNSSLSAKEGDKKVIDDYDQITAVSSGKSDGEKKNELALSKNLKLQPLWRLDGFEACDPLECFQICGTKENKKSFCDSRNDRLCMCAPDNFLSTNVEGSLIPVNRENPNEKNCSLACNNRKSYARVWHKTDSTKSCACLLNQVTTTGITLCDEFALIDICKDVCQSKSAVCVFNGVCLCRESWKEVFHKALPNIRNEVETDKMDCTKRCREYHTEFAPRIFDTKLGKTGNKTYEFREKYCLCGEELQAEDTSMMDRLHEQGFQECTGLKCKMRCGMNMQAECEPKFRRACLCPRYNIFIGKFLWARIPSRRETICLEACKKYGLTPRVIEWNPFYEPGTDMLSGNYRKSRFRYLYDGKFCHCVNLNNEPDINQFRPCTDELCQWICGHTGATCDSKTRRICICNTHQMVGGLGRRPDPGELNCNVICRRNLNDARILEVNWDIPAPHWSVPKAKFCGCVRPVTAAGLTHCEGQPGKDKCPTMCNNPFAYCTQQKFCECLVQPNILKNEMVRVPNGKEAEECGEVCRSWMWPITEDTDHHPYIFDESRLHCTSNHSCPEVDTTPWSLGQPGALKVQIDALEESPDSPRKFCLCAKTDSILNRPGTRFNMHMEAPRLPKGMQCILNYTCIAVHHSLHVVA